MLFFFVEMIVAVGGMLVLLLFLVRVHVSSFCFDVGFVFVFIGTC